MSGVRKARKPVRYITANAPTWRAAFVETAAHGFGAGAWIRQQHTVTVKPGADVADLRRELAAEYGVQPREVRLVEFP